MLPMLFFILALATTSVSSFSLEQRQAPTPNCDEHGGEAVCCDGDPTGWGTGVLTGCSSFNPKLLKCEHVEMTHCCHSVIAGVGIGCDETQVPQCAVPGHERARRHLRSRAGNGCSYSPSSKQSQGSIGSPVADLSGLSTYGDGSLDLFSADGGSSAPIDLHSSMNQDLWAEDSQPIPLQDDFSKISLGGGSLPVPEYSFSDSSLPDTDMSNLFLDA